MGLPAIDYLFSSSISYFLVVTSLYVVSFNIIRCRIHAPLELVSKRAGKDCGCESWLFDVSLLQISITSTAGLTTASDTQTCLILRTGRFTQPSCVTHPAFSLSEDLLMTTDENRRKSNRAVARDPHLNLRGHPLHFFDFDQRIGNAPSTTALQLLSRC